MQMLLMVHVHLLRHLFLVYEDHTHRAFLGLNIFISFNKHTIHTFFYSIIRIRTESMVLI